MQASWAWLTPDPGTVVIFTGIALLIVFAIWSGIRLRGGVRRVSRSLDEARRELEQTGGRLALPDLFETLDERLSSLKVVGQAWQSFSATLLLPLLPGQPIRQTIRIEKFFNQALLRRSGIDPRLHGAMPNLLVGGGLFFTFIGLILALHAASGSVVSNNIEESRNALHGLLNAASLKFASSLFGLGLSIAYLIFYKRCLRQLDDSTERFCEVVAARIPPVSPHLLAQESNDLLNQQLAAQQQLVTDLAVRLGERLDESFNRRLAEQMEPLRAAIERMAEGMGRMNQDALHDMVARFSQVLQDTAGEQLSGLAATLGGMCAGLDRLTEGFGEIQSTLRSAGQAAATDIAGAMESAAHEMKAASEASRLVMLAAADGMGAGIGAAIAQVSDVISELQARLSAGSEAAAERLREGADATMRAVGEAASGLGAGAEEAVARIRDGAAETARALEEAGRSLTAEANHAAQSFSATIRNAASGFGEQIEALRRGFSELPARMEDIVAALRAQGEAASAATSRLGPAAEALQSAAAQASAATTALHEVGDRFAALDATLSGTAEAQAAAGHRSAELAIAMIEASRRFEGLDRQLGAVLRELEAGLETMQEKIVSFVGEVDLSTERAVRSLAAQVEELRETLELWPQRQEA